MKHQKRTFSVSRISPVFGILVLVIMASFNSTKTRAQQASSGVATAERPLPAFPGAEGFGAGSIGGRGGDVYEVTNLDDSGPGSLRDAVSQEHRTVVFRISGTIDLKSRLNITKSYITIAGQTAPGDGICLSGYTFQIQAHDVIVRFVRSRMGDQNFQEDDSISILNGCQNVIVDHCSATWSVDEGLSTSGNDQNITVQWCLIAEALNHSVHAKGAHGYGSLARANGPVSWYHNLWAHNNSRNPRLGDAYGRGSHPFFDVRNNVMYDYGEICSGLTQGVFTANYVNNYARPGPNSKAKTPIHTGVSATNDGSSTDLTFYVHGNVFEGHEDVNQDNKKIIDNYEVGGKQIAKTVDQPFDSPKMNMLSAEDAYKAALAAVGACLPKRDSVDARIIQTVRDRSGKIIDSQKDVGGWPELKSAPPPVDSDHDGIPDEWERKYGLNPNDASDAKKDLNGDGYTNLEKYLNGIDPSKKIDWRDPKNNVDPLTAPLVKAALAAQQ